MSVVCEKFDYQHPEFGYHFIERLHKEMAGFERRG